MKKILFYTLLFCLASVGFTSCNDDEELTDSKITYYPEMEIQGDKFTTLPIGTPYVDKGCKGTLLGEDCTSGIVTEGVEDVDYNTAGLYYVTYSYTNKDGYLTKAKRTVAVCDPAITTNIEGKYTVQSGSYRNSGGKITEFSKYSVTVKKAAPGLFYVSDFFGGYYDQGVGYGSTTAMTGYIQLLADNSIKLLSSNCNGFADLNSLDGLENGKYDPATGEISFDAACLNGQMIFHVILK